MKKANEGLVGAQVLVNWPMRWADCDPLYRNTCKAEASANEAYFDETGVIVGVQPSDDYGRELKVKLDGNTRDGRYAGRLVELHQGAVTITALSRGNAEVVDLLRKILAAVSK